MGGGCPTPWNRPLKIIFMVSCSGLGDAASSPEASAPPGGIPSLKETGEGMDTPPLLEALARTQRKRRGWREWGAKRLPEGVFKLDQQASGKH